MGTVMKNVIKIDKLDPGTSITVQVILSRQFRLRLAIATAMIQLAGRVLGCRVTLENDGTH